MLKSATERISTVLMLDNAAHLQSYMALRSAGATLTGNGKVSNGLQIGLVTVIEVGCRRAISKPRRDGRWNVLPAFFPFITWRRISRFEALSAFTPSTKKKACSILLFGLLLVADLL